MLMGLCVCMLSVFQDALASRVPFLKEEAEIVSSMDISFPDSVSTLDPFQGVDVQSVMVTMNLHEGLLKLIYTGSVWPALAKYRHTSVDHKAYKFYLRRHIFFPMGARSQQKTLSFLFG